MSLSYEPTPRWRPRLPIPRVDPLALGAFSFALLAHLAVLIGAHAARRHDPPSAVAVAANRFVQVIVEPKRQTPPEPPKEEDEEEAEEAEEAAPPPPDLAPRAPAPSSRDEARALASERFGRGKAAVSALAAFLTSGAEQGKLGLGDASAALGSGASALALGSAFGDAGGDVSLGGGGGAGLGLGLGGGGGGGGAGRLAPKAGARVIKGAVKTLKSAVRLTGGALDKEAVHRAIQAKQAKISACYERQLLSKPNLSGMLKLAWEIGADGKVGAVREESSSLGDPALSQCVMGVIKTISFPKPTGGAVTIKYPFMFQQG
ncbi:MAG: AgmX/PglI C-terminal domain-containing protein [Deltaproteobacteria bacterium]|nr:AgmX/PglI C-terminal domain-containing protein [Deltaproteobacteria bacterium]